MCATTDTRVTDTLTFTAGQQATYLFPPRAGVDAQLWYTLAPALELFLQDEWDGDYPYAEMYVQRVVQVRPGQYRVTAVEGVLGAQPVHYLLECDDMAGAVVQYA